MNQVVHYGAFPAAPDVTPVRPGPWRIVSILGLALAIALVASGLVAAIGEANIGIDGLGVPTDRTRVEVAALGNPSGSSVEVLSIAEPERVAVSDQGSVEDLRVPRDRPFVVALYGSNGDFIGLATAGLVDGRTPPVVRVTPDSTARALIALSPSVLHPDAEVVASRVAQLSSTPEFNALVQSLLTLGDLGRSNPAVEQRLADVIDQLAVVDPRPDQQCDSVADPRAYAASGTCVLPSADESRATILNEQDRWLIAFGGETPGATCGIIPPAQTPPVSVTIDGESCGVRVGLAGPGPVAVVGEQGALAQQQVAIAAALHAFASYGAAFADIAGGLSGLSDQSDQRLSESPPAVGAAFVALLSDNRPLNESARLIADPLAAPGQRAAATVEIARDALANESILSVLSDDDLNPLVTGSGGAALLDLLGRSAARQTEAGFVTLWSAPSFSQLTLTGTTQ